MVVTLIAINPLRTLAFRYRLLDHPGGHKAHRRPVPYLGGVAVLSGVAVGTLVVEPDHWLPVFFVGAIALIGLYDDVRNASVAGKLVVEGAVAVLAVATGLTWHLTGHPLLDASVTVLWIVGVTNAFNLLDNMDGLTAVTGCSAMIGIALLSPSSVPVAAAGAGALLAFLTVNWPPARMYLGDAGSLAVGCIVGIVSIQAASSSAGLTSGMVLGLPVIVALFDTSLVIASRLLSRRPVHRGGTDHASHRLILLYWTKTQILGASAALTIGAIVVALIIVHIPDLKIWAGLGYMTVVIVLWLALLSINPYRKQVHQQANPELIQARG